MKKFFISSSIFCLAFSCFFLSACGIGIFTINFETYSDYSLNPKYYNPGESTIGTLPNPFGKTGYNFLYWCWDEDLTMQYNATEAGTGEITLYAKWEIQENFFIGRTVDWAGSESGANKTLEISSNAIIPTDILLNKTNTIYAFSNIEVQSTSGSYQCLNVQVFADNGKPIEDKNSLSNIWQPKDPIAASSGKYVIKITATGDGQGVVFVS